MGRVLKRTGQLVPLIACLGAAAPAHAQSGQHEALGPHVAPLVRLFAAASAEPAPAWGASVVAAPESKSVHLEPMLSRMVRALRPATGGMAVSPLTTGTVSGQNLVVAAADPNYARWSERAKKRLDAEGKSEDAPPHPLASAQPDSYVTVCEAGCRHDQEEVVYKVEKSRAITKLKPLYETTAADDNTKTPEPPTDSSSPLDDPAAIVCVAGCYDSPKVHSARLKRKAAVVPERAPEPAQTKDRKKTGELIEMPVPRPRLPLVRGRQFASNGAIVGPHRPRTSSALMRDIVQTVKAEAAVITGWNAVVQKAAAPAPERKAGLDRGWRTEMRRAETPAPALRPFRTRILAARYGDR